MNNGEGILIKVSIVFFVVVFFLFCWEILSISTNIGGKVKEAGAILKEIQQEEYPDTKKMESLLKVAMVSGVRG